MLVNFTNLLPESLRKQADKTSIVLIIPSILFISAYSIIFYIGAADDSNYKNALTWVILCHFLSIVAHLLTIVGFLSRIAEFYVPCLVVQLLLVLNFIGLVVAAGIGALYFIISQAIDAFGVKPFSFGNWFAFYGYKFYENGTAWCLIIFGGIGSLVCLAIAYFFLSVFQAAERLIKNEKYELERLRLCAVVEAQQRNVAAQNPAPILGMQPAALHVAPSNIEG